jgi:hypothetical protein
MQDNSENLCSTTASTARNLVQAWRVVPVPGFRADRSLGKSATLLDTSLFFAVPGETLNELSFL